MQTDKGKQAAAAARSMGATAEPFTLHKRIGSIVYEVEVHFNTDTKEGMNDKILRLIQRDTEAAA